MGLNLISNFEKASDWSLKIPNYKEELEQIEKKILQITPNEDLILPNQCDIFKSLNKASFDDLSVVIVGQDPYIQVHDIDGVATPQAMGLAFSVPKGIKQPPSLKNIFKEMMDCFPSYSAPVHGDLSDWTDRVLLLNTALTVEKGISDSHSKTGWKIFTQEVINNLAKREKPLVFLSWGRNAHKITEIAENTHHYVIKTSHPSPLGARKSGVDFSSFLGSRCFLKANDFLSKNGIKPIDWNIE